MSVKKRKNNAENYRIFSLWVTLATVVVLTLLIALFSLDSPTASAVQKISSLDAGKNLYFEVRGVEGLKDATVYVDQNVKDVIILFDSLPAIPSWFRGTFYSLFRVSSEDADKLSSMDLTLKLRKERMKELRLKKEDIKLYNNQGEISVRLVSETERYVSYLAHITRLGDYVIGKAASGALVPPASVEPPRELPILPRSEQAPQAVPAQNSPVVGEAIQAPSVPEQAAEEKGFWTKVKEFFSNLLK